MSGRGIDALIPVEPPAVSAAEVRGLRPDAVLMIAAGAPHRPGSARVRVESVGGLVVLTRLNTQVVMDRDAVVLAAMAAGLELKR